MPYRQDMCEQNWLLTKNIPFFDEWHCGSWRKQFQFANRPALTVDTILWQFDRWETLAWKSLQWCKHGTPHKSLAILRLKNKGIILTGKIMKNYK